MIENLIAKSFDLVDYPEIERLRKVIDERRIPLRLTGVTSRNLVAWKQKNLFDYPDNIRVKLNFKELLWLKIIQTLRDFGVSLNVIQTIKESLDEEYDIGDHLQKHKEKLMQGLLNKLKDSSYTDDELRNIEAAINEEGFGELIKSQIFGFSLMDFLISVMIATRTRIGIMLLDGNTCIPWMDQFIDINSQTQKFWQNNHLFISFNQYLSEFLLDESINDFLVPYNVLMPDEKTILDYIRDKAYKSIEVIFNDARKPEILKLTKAVATQERIVDILSRDNYAQITVTKRNGKIVNIKSEITEKLNKGKNPN
jgi:DNA-binding transcriptional MerR regulator